MKQQPDDANRKRRAYRLGRMADKREAQWQQDSVHKAIIQSPTSKNARLPKLKFLEEPE